MNEKLITVMNILLCMFGRNQNVRMNVDILDILYNIINTIRMQCTSFLNIIKYFIYLFNRHTLLYA